MKDMQRSNRHYMFIKKSYRKIFSLKLCLIIAKLVVIYLTITILEQVEDKQLLARNYNLLCFLHDLLCFLSVNARSILIFVAVQVDLGMLTETILIVFEDLH